MDTYDLKLNNEPEKAIRSTRRKITSIFDLTYTTSDIGTLDIWTMDQELATLSYNKIIVCNLADPEGVVGSMGGHRLESQGNV